MRVVAEIPHRDCKITIFNWNNKYLIKFEQAFLEQTYKINELDIAGEDEVRRLIDEVFIEEVLGKFNEMRKSLAQAMQRTDGI
jgi:hypothetical protein